jgi:hypothetical protein
MQQDFVVKSQKMQVECFLFWCFLVVRLFYFAIWQIFWDFEDSKHYLRTLKLFIVNIFVGNLAWGVDDVVLREAFEAHGVVERAKVVHDRETGRSRGFGFVEMPNQDEAEAALEAMAGKDLMGRPIRCNESEARERR